MTPLRIRALVAFILMVVAFAGAQAWRPTQHLAATLPKVDLETMFPKAFGNWVIDERMPIQLVSPDLQSALNKIYNQTLSRVYVNNHGERIMLSVAYGGDQSDATQAHRPEGCYPGQGFEISSSSVAELTTPLQPLRVRRLVARLGARVEPITYWMVVGDRNTVTGTEQKLAQLSYSARGTIPDGMLVRVSSIDANVKHAYEVQTQFVDALVSGLQPGVRDRVIGVASS